MAKPQLTQILDSLSFGDSLLRTLKGVEPLSSPYGRLIFSAGRESLVLKVLYNGEPYALKCYLRHQPFRRERHDYLHSSTSGDIIVHPQFFEKELYINDSQVDVALYKWVDGRSLSWMMRKALHDEDCNLFGRLLDNFLRLATTLLEGEWRHGDLKPENIIVRPSGEMILVDCDALYAPSLPPSAEGGTPLWVHPARKGCYDSHIDDYAIAIIVVSLAAVKGDLSLCKSESAVALPPQQNREAINQILANDKWLLFLHEAIYAPTHKIENLNNILKCIAHK